MEKAKVLVVEDDIHLLEGIRDILELDGYSVLTAENGSNGIEVLNNQTAPPDPSGRITCGWKCRGGYRAFPPAAGLRCARGLTGTSSRADGIENCHNKLPAEVQAMVGFDFGWE